MAVDVTLRDGTTARFPDDEAADRWHSWRIVEGGHLVVLEGAAPVRKFAAGSYVSVGGDPAQEEDD